LKKKEGGLALLFSGIRKWHRKMIFPTDLVVISSQTLNVDAFTSSQHLRCSSVLNLTNQTPKVKKVVFQIGETVNIHSVTAKDKDIKWGKKKSLVNINFKRPLGMGEEVQLGFRYTYVPEPQSTLYFPGLPAFDHTFLINVVVPQGFSTAIQGDLTSGKRESSKATFSWKCYRSRWLNLVIAKGKIFSKKSENIEIRILTQNEDEETANRILDLVESLINQHQSVHGKLPYPSFSVVETERTDGERFSSRGMIGLLKGDLKDYDEPKLRGVLINELSKEAKRRKAPSMIEMDY
jgi:hypothetical protein